MIKDFFLCDMNVYIDVLLISADNRKILHEQETEKMLILLLNHEDANVQVASAQALGVMSENLVSRDSIGMWGEKCRNITLFVSIRSCK